MMRMIYMGGIVLGLVFILMACQKDPNPPEMSKDDREPEAIETASEKDKKFVVALKDEEGIIRGTALLTQDKEEVHIDVEADHLREGQYGIHIHENGLCEAPSFETAGGHFNPENKEHGLENEEGAHAGDLENVVVEEDGSVKQQFKTDQITLQKDKKNSLYRKEGASIIMHEKADDGISQPAGDAGERMLCGVITSSSAE